MHHISAAVLAALLTATALTAQQPNPLAYPQDTITGSSGNLVPFGVSSTGSFAEGRTQLLFPATHLPSTGGALLGIAVHCQSSNSTLTYSSLDIDASHTAVTSLNTTFAANAPAPQPVLQATGLGVTYSTAAWTDIMFTQPFVYAGAGNLVLDIRKVATPNGQTVTMETTGNPPRTDLPTMLYEFGNLGTGMSQATVGRFRAGPLQVRLLWAGVPTMTLRSDRPSGGSVFALGGSIDVTTYAPSGSLYLDLVGLAFTPATLPPILGTWYVNGPILILGLMPVAGSATTTLAIPSNPSLPGLRLTFQAAVQDALTLLPSWTCAGDCIINP